MSDPWEAYRGVGQDVTGERALARQLRLLPDEERFTFVAGLLSVNQGWGLAMARSTLTRPDHFEAILDLALRRADASNIRWWIKCIVDRVGFHRVAA